MWSTISKRSRKSDHSQLAPWPDSASNSVAATIAALVLAFVGVSNASVYAQSGHLLDTSIGVTRSGNPIPAVLSLDAHDFQSRSQRILFVVVDSRTADISASLRSWLVQVNRQASNRRRFSLSAVLNVRPDSPATDSMPGGRAFWSFPPETNAYIDPQSPEPQYLWRWIGTHAPDLVVVVKSGKSTGWTTNPATAPYRFISQMDFQVQDNSSADPLVTALSLHRPANVGTIPAIMLTTHGNPNQTLGPILDDLLEALTREPIQVSTARRELQDRLSRSPREVGEMLANHYGHRLPQVVYIPAVALLGRLRLGSILGDESHLSDVLSIVKPYVDGDRDSTPTSGSGLSGHLIFAELAEHARTPEERQRFVDLAREAADLCFVDGRLPESLNGFLMPYHAEMSDAVFMGGPILARTGILLSDDRYADAAYAHLKSLRDMLLRDDGIYRHSPLVDTAWGRGNGFAAMGQAMCLSYLPVDDCRYDELLAAFRSHMKALVRHQSASGCWHQVVDHPQSYREFSCTCMIGFAMSRGLRRGWLTKAEVRTSIDNAWRAIRTRVANDGTLIDVCTGTGKQSSLRAYYDRPAILGKDDRGGAMALLFTTELAQLRHWRFK